MSTGPKERFAQTSSFFIGREAAISISFDDKLRQYEDYLFFISAKDHVSAYLYVDEPLTIWNDDERVDRLSRSAQRSVVNGRKFVAKAGGALGHKARLRFLMTHLGIDIMQQSALSGCALAFKAILARTVTPRCALGHFLKAKLS